MGMMSEIAAEATVRFIVAEIKRDMEAIRNKPDALAALKKIGRFALRQIEFRAPPWTHEYKELFGEDAP